jgi:hypothetical protein
MGWNLSTVITKKRRTLVWIFILLALEGLFFLRWLFFGPQSSPFDWESLSIQPALDGKNFINVAMGN